MQNGQYDFTKMQWIAHHLCANWCSWMFMRCSENDADKICTRAEIEVCYGAILTQWVEGGRGGWGLNIWRGKSFMGHFSSTGFTQCKNLSSHLPEDEKRRKMILNSNFKSHVCVGWCRYYVGGIRRLAALHMSPIIMDLSGRPQQKVYNYSPPRPRPMHSSFSGLDNAKSTFHLVREDIKRKVLFSFRHIPN